MGCFSFLCKECGKGINSTSFDGEKARLYWLKSGKVHQEMHGPYDSYGAVFTSDLSDRIMWTNQDKPISDKEMSLHHPSDDIEKRVAQIPRGAGKWDDPWPAPTGNMDWDDSDQFKTTGLAAVHERCFKTVPTTISLSDPDQGWGENGDLMGDTSTGGFEDDSTNA